MKINYLLLTTFLFSAYITCAQLPKPGKYQSADGRFAISVAVTANGEIEIKEPTKVSIYKKDGSNYRHSEPKYAAYMIRVGTANEIYTFKEGSSTEYRFNWVSSEEVDAENCTAYDKYVQKAEEAEGNEVQAWTFCAAAALAKCNYTAEGFKSVAAGVVASLKPILLDKKCPCDDVIPKEIWDAN